MMISYALTGLSARIRQAKLPFRRKHGEVHRQVFSQFPHPLPQAFASTFWALLATLHEKAWTAEHGSMPPAAYWAQRKKLNVPQALLRETASFLMVRTVFIRRVIFACKRRTNAHRKLHSPLPFVRHSASIRGSAMIRGITGRKQELRQTS